jgi:hypothetical protein
MCVILLYVGMALMGLFALISGKIQLTRQSEVLGVPARLIGVFLMLPFPLTLMGSFALGLIIAPTVQGKSPEQIEREIMPYAAGIVIGGIVLPVVLSVIIAMATSRRIEPKRRPRRDDDYDDRRRDDYDDQRREDYDDRRRDREDRFRDRDDGRRRERDEDRGRDRGDDDRGRPPARRDDY